MSDRRSSNSIYHAFVLIMCISATQWVPHDPVWITMIFVVMGINLGIQMRSYIKGPQLTAEQRLELSRQKTAELEKDLGYEPLHLHELDEIVLDKHKRRE